MAEALIVLEPLADDPRAGWVAAFELARVRLATGESRKAASALARAVDLNPGLTAAWLRWGTSG